MNSNRPLTQGFFVPRNSTTLFADQSPYRRLRSLTRGSASRVKQQHAGRTIISANCQPAGGAVLQRAPCAQGRAPSWCGAHHPTWGAHHLGCGAHHVRCKMMSIPPSLNAAHRCGGMTHVDPPLNSSSICGTYMQVLIMVVMLLCQSG